MKPTDPVASRPGRLRSFSIVLISLLFLPSCDSGPEMAKVHGRVTYQGKPLTKGTITFQPSKPDGRNATGLIDAEGYYTLQTEEPNDGAEVGGYYVAIVSRDDTILDYIPKTPVPPKRLIPEKYEKPQTSGLMRTVPRGGGTIDFILVD